MSRARWRGTDGARDATRREMLPRAAAHRTTQKSAAMRAIFRQSGRPVEDEAAGLVFAELDLLKAVDYVFGAV